ncbi:Beta-propeller domains of methanol dehydrogenase type [hydrothermal vent metagenome]|uniref:Beta-propeller domains of methanol dehydrogenase type n=1 Tax=hydrothermal vent metagenome TaxID=652676 RepID=A0A3B1DN62_9ZZZZ
MTSIRRSIVLSLITLLCLTSISWASTPKPPATPRNYVVDLAGIIRDDVERKMDSYLRELEQKTTAQMIVLTVKSLDGESIDGFSLRIAEKWKIGQKGKDNGVLFTVASRDRKYRFEIGYGLEGILPDSLVGSIGRQYIVPYFRKGDYSTGIYAAVVAVAQEIAGSKGVTITGMPTVRVSGKRARKEMGLPGIILTAVFLIFAVILFIKNPRLFLLLLLFSGGGRRGGWSGGGGFGGGGGGGFGGGGASGGW